MKVEPPKTLEDYQAIRQTTMDLMGNPYCDHFMFLSLSDKLDKIEKKINELTPNQ